ncbi:hypothetical protein JTE90_012684 [Oedothorax gibbosus]|uniref:Amino acid transporter transmembrane domain-containing protein n=1 Tax=Oedothorax gibbosus TaxID=931172 RepID=A0AAV6VZS7_9ARAC|nr:hypothetical protein JTE90_012684 [Oedothorax gibbosus]
MPYCFRKCGILLSMVLIFLSGMLTRIACYLLLKSAIMARRRNFEFLAFHTFGSTGKLAVEMGVIGFLIGVCIAFFVVIGDLGPPLAAEVLDIENSPNLRTNVLIMVGLCVALPLGLLRKIDSLTSLSALSIAFYVCLILKIFAEAVPNLAGNEWWYEVNWWKTEGLLPCLPIFSMALSCQTQLFEFFDTLNDPSIKRMQTVIGGAVYLCSTVYILVGTLGYIAFHDKLITGNILVLLTPSVITEIIKLGFILTVAVSFPLCLFPCRSSLHSLLFKQGFGHHDINVTVIPELRFRILTVSLIIVTISIAIMLPNIEFVLGIIGSTIGTLICLILPALIFIHDTSKNTTEKRMAQILMGIGTFILIACTFSTLQDSNVQTAPIPDPIPQIIKLTAEPHMAISAITSESPSPIAILKELNILDKEKEKKIVDQKILDDQKRLEPPIPQEPESKADPNADLDPQALQKEDKEIQKESRPPAISLDATKKDKTIEKQEKLLAKMEEQHKVQELLLEQQKKVLEELKQHKESHEEMKKVEPQQQVNLNENKNVDVPLPKPKLPEMSNVEEKDKNSPNQLLEKKSPNVIDINVPNLPLKAQKLDVVKNVSKESAVPNVVESHNSILNEDLRTVPALKEMKIGNKPHLNRNLTFKNVDIVPQMEHVPSIKENLNISPSVPISTSQAPLLVKMKATEETVAKENIAKKEIKNSPNDRILMREPLAEKTEPSEQINKNIKINEVLVGHQKLPV